MTTIALQHDPIFATPALREWLRRLYRRIAAHQRRRHYPSVRRASRLALDRWASETIRHR